MIGHLLDDGDLRRLERIITRSVSPATAGCEATDGQTMTGNEPTAPMTLAHV
jgi:hypothetical protein